MFLVLPQETQNHYQRQQIQLQFTAAVATDFMFDHDKRKTST